MSLIEFKNLPDTSTPLTAENLNNNFEYLDDKISDELYYKAGDTYTISHQYYAGGCLTGSSKEVIFTIILPKRLTNITSISVSGVNVAVRLVSGGYGINGAVSNSNVSIVDFGENFVSIDINAGSAIGTNNTPVDTYIRSLTLTFN